MTRLLNAVRARLRHVDDAAGERGSIALYFAIITLAALVMAGFVIDGGAALATRERAADLATQAARAGADALTPASLRGQPSGLQANPAAAQAAADRLLQAAGASGIVTVSGDQVTVKVTVHRSTVILSAVGLNDISQTASASATAIYGGTTQDGG
jgi:Flp pilus assembly protein TadG